MLIQKDWLEDYVNIPSKITPQELSDLITTRVVEIEGIIDESQTLDHVVVGKVIEVSKHPNADSLQVCSVDVGKKNSLQVICGGSNVVQGMKVAMGMIGARVRWHGEGDPIELKEAKIRGEKSFGMICAADEIGLGEMFPKKDEKEIVDLTDLDAKVGTPLADALGLSYIVLDIDNKSMTHRPDLWGHYGMAREVAAVLKTNLKPLDPPAIKKGKKAKLSVDIKATDGCHRFMGVVVDGVQIGPSPAWMQERLRSVGVRPINNIVDITNYVMFELGQPTHAYDAAKLVQDKDGNINLTVRHAKKNELFVTLDGQERTLQKEMFVIADKKKAVLLGGIMGGENSEVDENTTRVVFESANFDATVVRKMSQALGLRTDGSSRWEKSQDPNNADVGLRRLVELTKQLCPNAKVISNVVDEGTWNVDQGPIEVSPDFFEKKIGMSLKKKEIVDILERLGCVIKEKKDTLSVLIPTWRATKDISIPEDLVEEVARLSGFEHIPEALPAFEIVPAPDDPIKQLEKKFQQFLAYECGCTETLNYSFVGPDFLELLGDDTSKHLELNKPLAKDKPLIRRHLIAGLLENVTNNLHRYDRVNLFETGRVYRQEEKGEYVDASEKEQLPKQYTMLGMAFAAKNVDVPFYEVSSRFLSACERIGLDVQYVKKEGKHALVHPGRFADIEVNGTVVGHVAEVHPVVQERVGISYRTAILEVNLDLCASLLLPKKSYTPLAQYPSVQRDIALLLDANTEHDAIATALIAADPMTVDVELFDVYMGKGIEEGKKSMAYRLTYQSPEKTLTSEEVDAVHEKILDLLKKKFGASIR